MYRFAAICKVEFSYIPKSLGWLETDAGAKYSSKWVEFFVLMQNSISEFSTNTTSRRSRNQTGIKKAFPSKNAKVCLNNNFHSRRKRREALYTKIRIEGQGHAFRLGPNRLARVHPNLGLRPRNDNVPSCEIHPDFGFMDTRIQTWFPFTIQIGINGHEYLARQMDKQGMAYTRSGNCFPDIENLGKAQRLMVSIPRLTYSEVSVVGR